MTRRPGPLATDAPRPTEAMALGRDKLNTDLAPLLCGSPAYRAISDSLTPDVQPTYETTSSRDRSRSRERRSCDRGVRVMSRKLYVGNLPYEIGEAELQALFAKAGSVE